MYQFIRHERDGEIGILVLNRPEVLNAWHRPMRAEVVDSLRRFNADDGIGAIIMTGTGRAFCAGQDFHEASKFDGARAVDWIDEWRTLYGTIRGLDKPFVAALNGVAAGSAFQVALLSDVRVGHPGVSMGQPEINSGIPSITGFWIIRELLGLARTTELIVTGRMMSADECRQIGLIHHLVTEADVMPKALEIAKSLAAKPRVAMRLDKRRMCEATQAAFEETMEAAARIHREAHATGEPQKYMAQFLAARARRKSG